jgi:hypothetical protein
MTLPLPCPPPATSCPSSDPPAGPQRKRRRRAPASGASDDCFACTKRNTKCDRRRPYCSQCLEVGKECSGYKTQLTWGVGVASRGKLRGLSLPIARSAPAMRSPPPSRARTNSTTISPSQDNNELDGVKIKMETAAPISVHPFTTYDFVNMAPNGVTPPMHMPEWNMAAPHDYPLQDYQRESMCHQRQLPQLHRLHTHSLSLGRGDGLHMSSSMESLSAYADSDYSASPIAQSFPGEDSFLRSPIPMYNGYPSRNSATDASPVVSMMGGDSRGPTSCPDPYYAQSEISSSISSHQNLYDIPEGGRSTHPASASNESYYDDEILGKSILPILERTITNCSARIPSSRE